MSKTDKCKRCIYWKNEYCTQREMSSLGNGRPIKSCSEFYAITKYNSEYEVNRRNNYYRIVDNIKNDTTLSESKKNELIHMVTVFNLY